MCLLDLESQITLNVIFKYEIFLCNSIIGAIENSLGDLCRELNLNSRAIFTATTEEMRHDGYNTSQQAVRVHASASLADIVPTCNSLTVTSGSDYALQDSVSVNMDDDQNTSLLIPGQPHTLLADFLARVQRRQPPCHALTLLLMDTVAVLESDLLRCDRTFVSPVQSGKKLAEWSEYAHNKATKNSLLSNDVREKYMVCVVLK